MKSEIVREYPAVDTHNYITPKKNTKDQFVNGTNGNADSSKNTDELTNKNVDVSNKNLESVVDYQYIWLYLAKLWRPHCSPSLESWLD